MPKCQNHKLTLNFTYPKPIIIPGYKGSGNEQ